MSKCGLLIIIPAFNESATISDVIKQAREYGDVIVLDDASSDDTREKALEVGAKVVSNDTNLGYEKTLGLGFKAALGDHKYSYLVTLDGDGEHNPDDISRYLEKLASGAHLVCGRRSSKNRFSEEIWGQFGSRVYGIHDPLCGFKGYSLEFIRKSEIPLESNSLGDIIGTRLLKKMLDLKCTYENINIKVSQREGESKFGAGIRINLKILTALVQFLRA